MTETVKSFLARLLGQGSGSFNPDAIWKQRPALDARLHTALIARHNRTRKVPKNFNAIAVQFSKIDRALRQIKKIFQSVDEDNSQSISLEEMRHCFEQLKVTASASEIEELYKEADMDSNGELSFKEFIVTLAFIHLTHDEPNALGGTSRFGLPDVDKAFELIYDAFFFFDRDMDGVLSRPEIRASFSDSLASEHEGSKYDSLSSRFEEMDYDSNGQCTFKEFLFAFLGWVGTAEDDEDEDEDE
eukprot:TRINITY_DN357_c0_g2_i12.p1 TRINITY_DN357_c0_g2~~TRINITY_DN357_c0_g2_i12.p1  ORF type:complete len:244 (-),score=61.12 TRINITY_DN357_c0_g2_i12:2034-2765(-)